MIRGCQSRFCNETIAFAMELATEGVCWKLIERALGEGIYQCVRDAKRKGMHKK
mgnify:CR=1 FL=1